MFASEGNRNAKDRQTALLISSQKWWVQEKQVIVA